LQARDRVALPNASQITASFSLSLGFPHEKAAMRPATLIAKRAFQQMLQQEIDPNLMNEQLFQCQYFNAASVRCFSYIPKTSCNSKWNDHD